MSCKKTKLASHSHAHLDNHNVQLNLNQYRDCYPSTIHKIGSSCIANRLKKVLPSLVNEDQTRFISKRYMGDNIRLIYDLIHYLNCNNLPRLLICIDFEVFVFYSVDWNFMIKVLKAFGYNKRPMAFGPIICGWIYTFYNKIQSLVIVNRHTLPWFSIERGCHPGNPILPYLFLLCVELLGIMIQENRLIKGININDKQHKSMQFADDTQMMSESEAISFEQAKY